MFSINPLYAAIAGGVLALGAVGTIHFQGNKIHQYHTQLICVQTGEGCPVGKQIVTIPQLKATIELMKQAQIHQTQTTQENLPAVKPKPDTKKALDNLGKQPLPEQCVTPSVPEELTPYV